MKLNRRGFFGISAGAALAAPTVAKKPLSGGLNANSIAGGMSLARASPTDPAEDEWRLKQIVNLVRNARGKRSPEQESERQTFINTEHRMNSRFQEIDSLKSVSPRHKHIMADRASERERDRADKRFAVHRLLHEFKIPEVLWKDYE